MVPGRDLDWQRRGRRGARRTTACRSRPPIRSTSSTRRARPASPRAWCATMAATAVALVWTMTNIYGVEPGEVCWCASDVGWVVGHSYIVYGPLLHGCTTILYEGKPVGTPDAGAFWRVIAEHKAVAPVHRADRLPRHQEGRSRGKLLKQYDLSSFRTLFLAGERGDPPTVAWARAPARRAGRSITGGRPRPAGRSAANCLGIEPLPVKPGSTTVPSPGWDDASAGRAGPADEAGEIGALVGQACRCRPARCRRCGTPTSATAGLSHGVPRLLPDRRRRLSSTRTAMSTS